MSNRNKRDRRLVKQEAETPVPEFNLLAAFRKGPLPSPDELAKYETMHPGATKQLFDNFVAQTNHRMELEKQVILGDNKRADTAQRNSFIITIAILLLAAALFFMGKDGYAIAAVYTAIAPIVIAFITSSIFRKKERDKKRKNIGV